MNYVVSGSRPPRAGFTLGETELIREQVAHFPRGTRFGQGGSDGVDRLSGIAASSRGLFVVTFLPGASHRTYTAVDYARWTHEVRDTGVDPLSRDRVMVDWCTSLRAVALFDEDRAPRSGTWATIRMALAAGVLERVTILRPHGLPGPVVQEPRGGRLVTVEHLPV